MNKKIEIYKLNYLSSLYKTPCICGDSCAVINNKNLHKFNKHICIYGLYNKCCNKNCYKHHIYFNCEWSWNNILVNLNYKNTIILNIFIEKLKFFEIIKKISDNELKKILFKEINYYYSYKTKSILKDNDSYLNDDDKHIFKTKVVSI